MCRSTLQIDLCFDLVVSEMSKYPFFTLAVAVETQYGERLQEVIDFVLKVDGALSISICRKHS